MKQMAIPLLITLAVAVEEGSARAGVSLTGNTMVCVTEEKRRADSSFAPERVHAFVCTNALEAMELGSSDVLGGVLDPKGHVRCTIRGTMDLATACASVEVCGRSRLTCVRGITGALRMHAEEILRHLLRAR
jgi:hypothetical protein